GGPALAVTGAGPGDPADSLGSDAFFASGSVGLVFGGRTSGRVADVVGLLAWLAVVPAGPDDGRRNPLLELFHLQADFRVLRHSDPLLLSQRRLRRAGEISAAHGEFRLRIRSGAGEATRPWPPRLPPSPNQIPCESA